MCTPPLCGSGGGGNGSYSLAPGETHTVTVRFIPLVSGSFACSIDLGNAACAPVTCTALGVAAEGREFAENVIFVHQWAMTLLNVDGDTFTFQLPDVVPDIEVGDVIVGVRDDLTTYVHRVVTVVRSGGELILETIQASLVEIYSKLEKVDEIALPIEVPGSAGELAPGVRIANGGLEWDGINRSIPDVGYVRIENALVRVDNLVLDTGYRITNASVEELHNLIGADIRFGCNIVAGLDLNTAAGSAGMYKAPEVKIYENTKTFESHECLDVEECPFVVTQLCPQACVDFNCGLWEAARNDLCVDLCHEVTYTVYLGGEYSWSLASAAALSGGTPALPAAEIHLNSLNGGVSLEAGERYLNGAWEFIRNGVEIPKVGVPGLPSYSVLDLKPYVVVEIRDRVRFCDRNVPPFTTPVTRITYYLRSTTTSNVTEWCLDVRGGREIEILDTEIPEEYVDWLGENVYENWNPPLVDPDNWPVYHHCQSWIPFPRGE